jgi:glutathionyl-hydroquinone reductase
MMNYHAECVYALQMMETHNAKKRVQRAKTLFMNAICDEHQGSAEKERHLQFVSRACN